MPLDDMPWRGPLSFRFRGWDVPVFAILGGIGTGLSFVVTVLLHFSDYVAPVGLAWLAIGMIVYVHVPPRPGPAAHRRPSWRRTSATGPALEVEYRSILMPISADRVDDVMTATALRLAAESNATLVLMYPIEVPLPRPMAAPLERETAEAEHQLREAAALARSTASAWSPGSCAPATSARRSSRRPSGAAARSSCWARETATGRPALFGPRVDYVLRNARCRVMVGAEPARG